MNILLLGDPLGLFSIDSSTQSLTLLDESRARSYTYPIHLTVLDISHTEPITCMVTVMISNIAVKVTCPSSSQSSSLYLPTYSSSPSGAVDSLSGERYTYLDSLRMRVFDPLSSSHLAECVSPVVKDRKTEEQRKEIDFVFEQQTYSGYANHSFKYIYRREEPMHLAIQYRELYLDPFAITYQFVLPHKAPDSFDLDPHAGIIHYFPRHDMNSSIRYSLIVLARYHSFITLVRLNIVLHPEQMHHPRTSYRFSLIIPSVNNYTVGHLEASEGNWTVLNSEIRTMFAIDAHGRLFVANRTFISTEEKHLFAFFVQDQFLRFIRIEIILRAKQLVQCVLNRFPSLEDEKLLIGFVEIFQPEHPIAVRYDSFTRKSFSLLNYNHLFELDRDHGLLSCRNAARTVSTEIELLIEIDNVRCLIALNDLARPSYLMIRSGGRLHAQLQQQMHSAKVNDHESTLGSKRSPFFRFVADFRFYSLGQWHVIPFRSRL